jgi:hypothetical protein
MQWQLTAKLSPAVRGHLYELRTCLSTLANSNNIVAHFWWQRVILAPKQD